MNLRHFRTYISSSDCKVAILAVTWRFKEAVAHDNLYELVVADFSKLWDWECRCEKLWDSEIASDGILCAKTENSKRKGADRSEHVI